MEKKKKKKKQEKKTAAPKYLTSDCITETIAQEEISSSTEVGL